MRCIDPLVKRDLGALKDSAHGDAELRAAIATEQQARTVRSAIQAAIAIRAAAVGAYRAIRPADRFKVLARRIFVIESGQGVDCFGHLEGFSYV